MQSTRASPCGGSVALATYQVQRHPALERKPFRTFRQVHFRFRAVPATFDERFQTSLPPSAASPAGASPDDLEVFRRQWLKSYLEP